METEETMQTQAMDSATAATKLETAQWYLKQIARADTLGEAVELAQVGLRDSQPSPMPSEVSIECPKCLVTWFAIEGAPAQCPNCGLALVPDVVIGEAEGA